MKCLLSSNRGFTLVEVVVSLVVFTSIMLVFSATVPQARKAAEQNGQYAQALSLCQHKIDQMRAVGFGRLNYTELEDAEIIDTDPSNQSYYSFDGVDGISDYLINPDARITITALDSKTSQVTAAITWQGSSTNSKTSNATLTAIITNVTE